MSDNQELVVSNQVQGGGFSMSLLNKVKGLSEDSPLKKMKSEGQVRFTVFGNKFYIKQGKNETLIKDAKKKPAREVLVVLHSGHPIVQRQAAEPYNAKLGWQPLGCWANGRNAPDDNCWNKQADLCDECPEKMGKCSLMRNLALSLYQPGAAPEDIELMLMTTNWSSNSTKKNGEDPDELIFGLINYMKFLANQDVDLHRVVTRLIIDLDSENEPANNCKVLFQPAGVLDESSPNLLAHDLFKEGGTDLAKFVEVSQRQPDSDETVGGTYGAGDESEEEEAPKRVAKKTASKKVTSKKKAAAKKKPEPVEEEEVDLDDLDEDLGDELVDEDPDDMGVDLDDDDLSDLSDLGID